MARKDVELVIRAKDEATKAVNAITTAINSLVESQGDLSKTAGKSDTAISRLGQSFAELEKTLKGATLGQQITRSLDNATKAASRLEAAVVNTGAELEDLKRRSAEAAAATDRLRAAAAEAGQAVEREAAALAKAKQAAGDQAAVIRQATADRQQLMNAEARLTGQIVDQQAKLDAATAKYRKLGEEIAKTATPSKALQTSLAQAGDAVAKQQTKLDGLQTTLGTVRAAIGQVNTSINRFETETAGITAAVEKQSATLEQAKRSYVELGAATKAAGANQRTLVQETENVAGSLDAQRGALERAQAEMGQLTAAAGKADAALAELGRGSTQQLQTAFDAQRRAMLETRREWVQSQAAVKALAADMVKIGPPVQEQAVAWNKATIAARAAKEEYLAQRAGLEQLSKILQQTGGDVDELRARQQQFVQVQAQTGAALAAVRARAAEATQAYERLSVATRAAGQARGPRPADLPDPGLVDRLSLAYRSLYGETRSAMSITQRLRGEVLSLVAAYGGIFGVINLLQQTIDAYKTLEAAQSRLGALFDQDQSKVTDELDFIRRNADRLGLAFGVLADEYTKFAASTQGTNLEGAKTRKIFISVAEAARVNKLSFEDLQGVFRALTQIASKGRVQLEELSGQLGDRMPGALKIMADGLGVTTAELLNMTKQGEVTSDELVGFAEELDRRYGKQLASSLLTTTTALNQMGNAAFQALLVFANGGFIQAFTQLVRDLTETLRSADFLAFAKNMSAALGQVIGALGVMVRHFELVSAAVSAFIAIKIIPFVLAIGTSILKLTGTMTGLRAAIAGIILSFEGMAAAAGVGAVGVGRLSIVLRALLSSTGIGLAITAIAAGFGLWAAQADKATEAMTSQQAILDQIKNAYDAAAGSADKFATALQTISASKIRDNLLGMKDALADLAKPESILPTTGLLLNLGDDLQKQINDATKQFNDGVISLEDYKAALEGVAQAAQNPALDAFVSRQEDNAAAIQNLRDKIGEANAQLKLIADPTNEAAKAALGLHEAMDAGGNSALKGSSAIDTYTKAVGELKKAIPGLSEELKKLNELTAIQGAYIAAINSAQTIGQAINAFNLREAALSAVNDASFDDTIKALGKFSDGVEASAELLRRKEGFIANTKFDVNHERVGFGSDTVTLADGTVKEVVKGMTVSVTDANRDLYRRIADQQRSIIGEIGAERFKQFNAQQQAAITSIAYNYGNLVKTGILNTIKTGTTDEIVTAIRSLGSQNGGVNRDRRNEEAAVFGSKAGVEAETDKFVKDREKALELEKKQTEEAGKFHEEQATTIANQQTENALKDESLLKQEIAKALQDAENAATKAHTQLTEEERQKIIQTTTAKFADASARKEAADAEQKVNDILAQRSALEDQLKQAKESGDTGAAQKAADEITNLNSGLQEAIDKAIAMWQAVGGTGADAAIAKLRAASTEAANFKVQAQQSFIDWSRVGQLFASGLSNAVDKFFSLVAEGKSTGDAAKEAFLQFAADFLRQIAQMIIQQATLNLLRGIFGGSFGAAGFHTGGVVGRNASFTRQVDPSVFANAARFHGGGLPGLKPNEVPAILKKGEEVLSGDDPRNILNAASGTSDGSGPPEVRIINAIDSGDFVSKGMQTKQGQKAFMNFIRENSTAVQRMLNE